MKKTLGVVLLWAVATGCSSEAPGSQAAGQLPYPETRRGPEVDDYHGVAVADPYRWLEDIDNEETAVWVTAQNSLTEPLLQALPERAYFQAQLRDLGRRTAPAVVRRQGPYWVTQTRRPDGARVFYVQEELGGSRRVLLDPGTLGLDAEVFVEFARISPNGRYVAYTVAPGGRDLMEVRVRDLATGMDLADRIPGLKFDPPFWTADSRGLVYYRYLTIGPNDGVDSDSAVLHHTLGTPVEEDRILARSAPGDAGATTWAEVSHDGRFVVVIDGLGTQQRLSILDLVDPLSPVLSGPLVALSEAREPSTRYIGHVDGTVYLQTGRDAPSRRVVAVDLEQPRRWRTVLPESEDLLQHSRIVGRRIVAVYLRDVKNELESLALDGSDRRTVPLPAPGSTFYLSGDPDGPVLTFAFDAFTYPQRTFGYNVETGAVTSVERVELGPDPAEYTTTQRFAVSRDGTRVPMFVVHRRELTHEGATPTLLYGYGAVGGVESPIFRDDFFTWIEAGGILAVANVRGGGEYGEAWQRAGMLEQKQNTYDDFIAAAETLVRDGYTSPEHLAAFGESNGGMLVGAVMTQRPDLFAVALPVVGVLDALRFPNFTAGPRWAAAHGDPTDPRAFRWLYGWSPLHRIEDGVCYPATLVTTAVNDDLVHPSQSYKFAARLQAAQGCNRPILLRVYPTGAHGILSDAGTQADILAFAARHLGLEVSPQ